MSQLLHEVLLWQSYKIQSSLRWYYPLWKRTKCKSSRTELYHPVGVGRTLNWCYIDLLYFWVGELNPNQWNTTTQATLNQTHPVVDLALPDDITFSSSWDIHSMQWSHCNQVIHHNTVGGETVLKYVLLRIHEVRLQNHEKLLERNDLFDNLLFLTLFSFWMDSSPSPAS